MKRLFAAALIALFTTVFRGNCVAVTYATINDISPTQLTNSVQITVKADGILDWSPGEYDWITDNWSEDTDSLKLKFIGARSSVKNFVDVSMYPVSYVQTYVPQDAEQCVGISLVVGLFTKSACSVTTSPDRQSVIITVKTTQTLEKTQRGVPAAVGPQKTELNCSFENGLMTIAVLKTDMLKVLSRVAKEAGLNIVVDDAVAKRTVSMSLENTPPDDVLRAITAAYGLALSKMGDVYMVSEGVPTDLATYRASDTQSFPMTSVRAQTASELLPTFLYSYLHVNAEQNAVVVTAPAQMLDKIGTDLQKVDIAPPQIMIEAMAIESSSVADLAGELGISQGSATDQATVSTATGDITYTTIGALPNEFEARLKALVGDHKAKINTAPRMAVVNGKKAEIFVGAQRFMRVKRNSYGSEYEQVQGVDVGTKISVTPWTGGNGEITTTLAPQVSNIIELDRATGLPTLSTRKASTTVRVKDGGTIVIGGLTQKQDYWTDRKIPILGDLPVLGALFQSRDKSTTKTDLLLLIRPTILTETGHMPNAAEEARIKERMLNQSGAATAQSGSGR